jgi:hypothetical protein
MTHEINSCTMPTPATRKESELYRLMRDRLIKAHCADKRPAHRCAGKITIDREHITFQCPRCGDARQLILPEGEIP